MSSIQEDMMKIVQLNQLKREINSLFDEFKRLSAIDDFLFSCIMFAINDVVFIPLNLLLTWKLENLVKIFGINDQLDGMRKKLVELAPSN